MADLVHLRLNTGDADRDLRLIGVMLSDLRPFWPRVRRLFADWMRVQFASEGEFWGHPWHALSPAYADRKRILWGDRPILQASGQAYRAALTPVQARIGPKSLTLAIDDSGSEHGPVLQYHQTGDGVPRRIVIGETLPASARAELQAEADDYVRDFLRRF